MGLGPATIFVVAHAIARCLKRSAVVTGLAGPERRREPVEKAGYQSSGGVIGHGPLAGHHAFGPRRHEGSRQRGSHFQWRLTADIGVAGAQDRQLAVGQGQAIDFGQRQKPIISRVRLPTVGQGEDQRGLGLQGTLAGDAVGCQVEIRRLAATQFVAQHCLRGVLPQQLLDVIARPSARTTATDSSSLRGRSRSEATWKSSR